MIKRDIHVSDVTPFDPKPMRNMIEPDQRYVDLLVDRGNIPPLDGAVPEATDYYSLGSPQSYLPHQRRDWMRAVTICAAFVVCSVAMWALALGAFVTLRALYRAVFS